MTIEISREIGTRLIDEARKQGISVEALLERLVIERLPVAKSAPALPSWHLGAVGSLRRVDIYDDVD